MRRQVKKSFLAAVPNRRGISNAAHIILNSLGEIAPFPAGFDDVFFGDVDILISPKSFKAAADLMEQFLTQNSAKSKTLFWGVAATDFRTACSRLTALHQVSLTVRHKLKTIRRGTVSVAFCLFLRTYAKTLDIE